MHMIQHDGRFCCGTIVLMLKGRHKDGIENERAVVRVTHSVDHFSRTLDDLVAIWNPGERIYASASERCMQKAIREFKRRQLDADYDDDPERFYRGINERWVSCLMAPIAQSEKLWLFGCDTQDQARFVMQDLDRYYHREMQPYRYHTKSGEHIVVQPFDRTKLSDETRALIHENPLILWAY